MSRFLLRVDGVAGARGNSPAFGGLRQSARLFPSTPSMLGAGQKEIKIPEKQIPLSSHPRASYLRTLATWEQSHRYCVPWWRIKAVKKTEPEESARATSLSGSPTHRRTGRTRRNSPRYRGAQTAAASFSSGATMRRPRDNGERQNTTASLLRGINMSLYQFGVVRLPIRHAGPPTSSLRRRPESFDIF